MKILTIIGNGFDLGHNLPTQFDNFIKSNYNIFSQKYGAFRNENNNWKDVESQYKQLLCEIMRDRKGIDITEEIDNIIQGYGFNEYGEVDYYNYTSEAFMEEYEKIFSFINLLNQFEQDFLEYLKANCCDEQLKAKVIYNKIEEILSASTKIINFNYTNAIEVIYGIKDIVHIHGNIDNSIAIGCGTLDEVKESMIDDKYPTIENFGMNKHGFAEMMAYYEEDMEGNLVENHFIKRFFDEVSSVIEENEVRIFTLLDEKSKDSLALRKQIIKDLPKEHYDKVYIIGHSLGEADHAVLEVINKDAIVNCFYHTDKDYEHMKNTLGTMNFNFELLSDIDLYKK